MISAGAVYTFVKGDDGFWSLDATLTAPTPAHGGGFGAQLALDGDLLYASHFGAVEACVFRRKGGRWELEAVVNPPSLPLAGYFAYSLAGIQGRLVVGAPTANVNGVSSGAVHLYARTPDGEWGFVQTLAPPLTSSVVVFGASCAFSDDGTRLFVGAPLESTGGPFVGAIHVYDLVGELWQYSHTLYGDPPVVGGFLGWDVVVDGDHLYSGRVPGDTQEALLFSGVLALDCNGNGVADGCDVDVGGAPDGDGDGIPDECEPARSTADLDGDGAVSGADLAILLGAWGTGGACGVGCNADITADGAVGDADLAALLADWT